MTIATFFKEFDQFAEAPDAVKKMLAPLPGCAFLLRFHPVVSLRLTTGYRLQSPGWKMRIFRRLTTARGSNRRLWRSGRRGCPRVRRVGQTQAPEGAEKFV